MVPQLQVGQTKRPAVPDWSLDKFVNDASFLSLGVVLNSSSAELANLRFFRNGAFAGSAFHLRCCFQSFLKTVAQHNREPQERNENNAESGETEND